MSVHPMAVLLVGAMMLAPTLLHAEPLTPRNKPMTVTVRITTNLPIGPGADEAALHQQARLAFYKTAAGECALITQSLKGDCTVAQVNISTRRIDGRMTVDQPSVSNIVAEGTMSFAVTPAGAPQQQ